MEKFVSNELMEVLKTKKAFIFDFDGTLSSTSEILFQTLKRIYSLFDYDYKKEQYDMIKNRPSNEFANQFKELVKEDVDAKFIGEKYLEFFDELAKTQKLDLYDYVKEIVSAFPNKVYCVASNNVYEFLEQRIGEFGLKKLVKNIFACQSSGMTKKYVYQNIKALSGVKPQDCVLFEDTQRYIDEAKEEGFVCVAIVHKDNKNIKADFYINIGDDD